MKFILFATCSLLLTACATSSRQPEMASLKLNFQFGQTVTMQLLDSDPAMNDVFLNWVEKGVYQNTPVYRQLPGVFVLTGKPRLKGQPFIPGTTGRNPKPKEATTGYAGLVIHADGSVGPELILSYGDCFAASCDGPANIRIAKLPFGFRNKEQLRTIQRGDNLINVEILPNSK